MNVTELAIPDAAKDELLEEGLNTVADVRAYLEAGNKLTDISGIGPAYESAILGALPAEAEEVPVEEAPAEPAPLQKPAAPVKEEPVVEESVEEEPPAPVAEEPVVPTSQSQGPSLSQRQSPQ
jgi:hypothetical protein